MSPRDSLAALVGDVSGLLLARVAVAVAVLALLAPAAASYATYEETTNQRGTLESVADNETVVSVQGFHFEGEGSQKKPSGLVGVDRRGRTAWTLNGSTADWPVETADQSWWFYDVDPLPNGNLLVVNTFPGETFVHEYDPETDERVWGERFPGMVDTHDVASLNDEEIAVANMRNYDEEAGVSDDRVVIYNRTRGEITWEWYFRNHYSEDTDGGYNDDWSHVNDVDPIGEEYLLLSPRNFDQVVVVDRATKEIVMRLGEDDDHATLYEQHNPDYLEREDGTPTMLVADSENDRIVEYERDCGDADPRLGAGTPPEDCEWELVWAVDGFNWPRDADRLPSGNTLVTDSLNHRVVEVTPEGEVVWEFHATWAPYDAERGAPGSDGPTMADRSAGGRFTVSGGADDSPASRYRVADAIAAAGAEELASTYGHVEPWVRPAWMGSWAFLAAVVGVLVTLTWG
ncbi:hypothetical protein BRD02_10190, partial [Halobacteriales archaeon QS_8_69_73]